MDDQQLIERVNQFIREHDLEDTLIERVPEHPPPDKYALMHWVELEAPQPMREALYREALVNHSCALHVAWQSIRRFTNIQELGLEEMILELEDITNTN